MKIIHLKSTEPNERDLRNLNYPIPCGTGRVCIDWDARHQWMFPSFRLCGKSKVDIVKIVAFKFQSSQPARVGSVVISSIVAKIVVSIIPAREGWVRKDRLGLWAILCFNHPSPWGLGRVWLWRLRGWIFGFNHPNPRGLGLIVYFISWVCLIVSIIPTCEGWVKDDYTACEKFGSFNHPNQRWLGQRIEGGLPYRYKFQSSQPARVGSWICIMYLVWCVVSIIPTREGWVAAIYATLCNL